MKDDDDDDDVSDAGSGAGSGAGSVQALSSDDEFNASVQKPVSANSSTSGGANMFDSLKEDSPVKKAAAAPSKRKLGPKSAEVKKSRIKKRPVSDDSSDDDFVSKKVRVYFGIVFRASL